jgi:hypothetical protein
LRARGLGDVLGRVSPRRTTSGALRTGRAAFAAAGFVGVVIAAMSGGSCAVGTSLPGCASDGECGGAYVCRGGACIAFTTTFDAGDDGGGGS